MRDVVEAELECDLRNRQRVRQRIVGRPAQRRCRRLAAALPTSTTVEVRRPSRPELMVEIEVTALLD